MNKLMEIIEAKKSEVEELHRAYDNGIPADNTPLRPSFRDALSGGGFLKLIAEVKRSSPSMGDINSAADPVDTARVYSENGASAVSVLTDRGYFGGSWEFLRDIAAISGLPLLCKDFIIDTLQIDLARAYGASAVLLITEALADNQLARLYRHTQECGLDALVEAHLPKNIERAAALGAPVIGINNRDLATFELDPDYALKYAGMIPGNRIRLALSGVETPADALKFARAGFDGILVGTSLMRSKNPSEAVRALAGIERESIS